MRFLRLSGDERLVELVRAGDAAAFEAVYDRHHRPILAFCRHMLGSADEAEDAVQQVFLSAFRSLPNGDRPVALRPWLYAVARNRCLSMLRARRDDHVEVQDDTVAVSVAGLAEEVQQREDLRAMLGDLAGLPEQQRAALLLAELGDLSHDEIGEVIGVPAKKVKALVFQARESLVLSREAREIPCREIREQLSTLHGGALRRAHLRRHLRDCPGCTEFRNELRMQRAALAAMLPVMPSAGLKEATLGAIFGGGAIAGSAAAGGGGAAATAGGLAGASSVGGTLLKGAAAKILLGLVLAGGAATTSVVGLQDLGGSQTKPLIEPPAATHRPNALGAAGTLTAPAAANAAPARGTRTPAASSHASTHARRGHKRHGGRSHRHHRATAAPAPAPVAAPAPSTQADRESAPAHSAPSGGQGNAQGREAAGGGNGGSSQVEHHGGGSHTEHGGQGGGSSHAEGGDHGGGGSHAKGSAGRRSAEQSGGGRQSHEDRQGGGQSEGGSSHGDGGGSGASSRAEGGGGGKAGKSPKGPGEAQEKTGDRTGDGGKAGNGGKAGAGG